MNSTKVLKSNNQEIIIKAYEEMTDDLIKLIVKYLPVTVNKKELLSSYIVKIKGEEHDISTIH